MRSAYGVLCVVLTCAGVLLGASCADALEYGFGAGQQRTYKVFLADPPARTECLLSVTCEKVGTAQARDGFGGLVDPQGCEYHLCIVMSDMRIRFDYQQKASYPYDCALERVTNFSYDVVMHSSGALLASTYTSSVLRVDAGCSNDTALVLNDVIRPLTIAIWRNLFPRFGEVEGGRQRFRSQDCGKFGMPLCEELKACRDGYLIKQDAKVQDGGEGCAIWEDVVELGAARQLGYAEDVETRSQTLLLFDTAKKVFRMVLVSKNTESRGVQRKAASRVKAYFLAKLIEPSGSASPAADPVERAEPTVHPRNGQ